MKTHSYRRRSMVATLSFFPAILLCIGCESSDPPATALSRDATASQSEPAAERDTRLEKDDLSPHDGSSVAREKNSGNSIDTPEDPADSATPASPPAAAKSPVMSTEAFLMAAGEGRTADVKRALDSGMNIEAAEIGRAHTALHHAAFNGHTATVLFLIKQGAKLDCRDHEGKTPLIHACTGPFPETVQALVNAGADVDARGTAEGFTPLMMAAGLDQLKSVQILLQNGANKEAVDDDNDKAVDHARRAGLTEIIKVLQ